MQVRLCGTRGSIPVALTPADIRRKIEQALALAIARGVDSPEKLQNFIEHDMGFGVAHTYGGHSPCVELETSRAECLVCDMGSGARAFGDSILPRREDGAPPVINVIITHVHWHHIMGFPFFPPAHVPGARIRIHACHDVLERALRLQQSAPCFPVDFSRLAAEIEFVQLKAGASYDVAYIRVTPKLQWHTGEPYRYRFGRDGNIVVYSTDSEHKLEDLAETRGFVDFFRNADLVIFDAMYSLLDVVSMKEDWGHSSNIVGVEMAQMASFKHLCAFHHEPAFNDERIESVLNETNRLENLTRTVQPLTVTAAYDGMEIEL